MGISNLTGKRVKNVKESAVSDNLLQSNYTTNFGHFDILVLTPINLDSLLTRVN